MPVLITHTSLVSIRSPETVPPISNHVKKPTRRCQGGTQWGSWAPCWGTGGWAVGWHKAGGRAGGLSFSSAGQRMALLPSTLSCGAAGPSKTGVVGLGYCSRGLLVPGWSEPSQCHSGLSLPSFFPAGIGEQETSPPCSARAWPGRVVPAAGPQL